MNIRYLQALALALGCTSLLFCQEEEEGEYRALSDQHAQRCASGYWQDVAIHPLMEEAIASASQTYPRTETLLLDPPFESSKTLGSQQQKTTVLVGPPITATSSASLSPATSPVSVPAANSAVGYWYCIGQEPPTRQGTSFTASYKPGGRMASVYLASTDAAFRCDIKPPSDEFYVAVWTRFDMTSPKDASQPQPSNCGDRLQLFNPATNRNASALVIDRCQSCVGVGHQASDPTTPDNLVNGATIDLSEALFNYLYDGAEAGVYDIQYDGPIYGGSDTGEPDALESPYCLI